MTNTETTLLYMLCCNSSKIFADGQLRWVWGEPWSRIWLSLLRAIDGSALSVDSAALSVDRAAIDRLRCVVGRSWLAHQRLSNNQYQHSRRVFRTLLEIAQDNNSTISRRCAIHKRALDSTFTAANRMSKLYNQKKRKTAKEFTISDRVRIGIPKLDRTATDLLSLPCVIARVHGDKIHSYSLTTEFVSWPRNSGQVTLCHSLGT